MFSNLGVGIFSIHSRTNASITCLFYKHFVTWVILPTSIGKRSLTIRKTIKTTSGRLPGSRIWCIEKRSGGVCVCQQHIYTCLQFIKFNARLWEGRHATTLVCRFENCTVPTSKCGGPITWRGVYITFWLEQMADKPIHVLAPPNGSTTTLNW